MKSRHTKRKNREAVANAVKELVNSAQNPQKLLPMEGTKKQRTEDLDENLNAPKKGGYDNIN